MGHRSRRGSSGGWSRVSDITDALAPLADVCEQLGLRIQVGGSVATAAYGVARTTLDVDVVIDLPIALHKLLWYELGHRIATRQWEDVVGVVAVNRASLDWEHIESWARVLAVDELVDELRTTLAR